MELAVGHLTSCLLSPSTLFAVAKLQTTMKNDMLFAFGVAAFASIWTFLYVSDSLYEPMVHSY
jgi:hypothetical protein